MSAVASFSAVAQQTAGAANGAAIQQLGACVGMLNRMHKHAILRDFVVASFASATCETPKGRSAAFAVTAAPGGPSDADSAPHLPAMPQPSVSTQHSSSIAGRGVKFWNGLRLGCTSVEHPSHPQSSAQLAKYICLHLPGAWSSTAKVALGAADVCASADLWSTKCATHRTKLSAHGVFGVGSSHIASPVSAPKHHRSDTEGEECPARPWQRCG